MQKVNVWLDNYIPLVPMSDEQWRACVKDVKELERSARGETLIIKMLLAGYEYLEELEKEIKITEE